MRAQLEKLAAGLNVSEEALMSRKKNEYLRLAAKLDALSPLKVLSRGYAIAMDGAGRALRSAADVNVGDALSLRLAAGSLECRVEDIHGEKD